MRYTLSIIVGILALTSVNSLQLSPSNIDQRTHEGGLSSVDPKTIHKYFYTLQRNSKQKWANSILSLQKIIYGDPVLRYNWEYGISQSENLKGKSGKQVLDMLNTVLNTPPAFDTSQLVGFPINVIFKDLMHNQNGRLIFSHKQINNALKDVFRDYAKMLDSKQSLAYMNHLEPKGWFSPTASKLINYSDFVIPKNGFKNWNEWFLRKFKPGKRPIGAGTPQGLDLDNVIINACESSPLTSPYQPIRNVKISDQFWLKDDKYSLEDILGQHGRSKGYNKLFVGGTVYQAYLSALNYHRWHAPIDGTIEDVYKISGTYYYDRSQFFKNYDPQTDQSQSFLTQTAARMVILIKAKNQKIGRVAIVFIGMAEVSGCIAQVKIGEIVKKGDSLGHFIFGGSSHAILFQKQVNLNFTPLLYQTINGVKKRSQQKLSSYLAHIA